MSCYDFKFWVLIALITSWTSSGKLKITQFMQFVVGFQKQSWKCHFKTVANNSVVSHKKCCLLARISNGFSCASKCLFGVRHAGCCTAPFDVCSEDAWIRFSHLDLETGHEARLIGEIFRIRPQLIYRIHCMILNCYLVPTLTLGSYCLDRWYTLGSCCLDRFTYICSYIYIYLHTYIRHSSNKIVCNAKTNTSAQCNSYSL